jgi:hypothetical protein
MRKHYTIRFDVIKSIVLCGLLISTWLAVPSVHAQTVEFSHKRGFYPSEFDLTLTVYPGLTAHYTLDGSEPTQSDPLISGPLRIKSRASIPNSISMISSTTTSYAPWAPPKGTVFKVTVLRVATFASGVKIGPTHTHTYVVHPAGADRYSLPVISIATDSLNVFDYEKGIYVNGKIYDDWKKANPTAAENGGTPANYHQRGDDWERPVHFEMFEDDGSTALAMDAGVRIHGSWARAFRQKTLRLYARNDYSTNRFKYKLFPDRESDDYRRFILRNSGQDWTKTMLRDGFMQRLVQDLSFDTQHYRPTIVFLNGEFWGIHNIRDRYDDHYLEQLYGVPRGQVDILELNAVVEEGNSQHYKDMIAFIRANNFADNAKFNQLQTMMDVYNFGEYNMSNIFINNRDWPHNNIVYWRKQTNGYQPDAPFGHDGRWRWMMKDTDFGFGWNLGADAWKFDMVSYALSPTGNGQEWSTLILRKLMENARYRNWFLTRFADLLNTHFHPDRVLNELNSMSGVIKPHIQEHLDRWGYNEDRWATPQTVADWESNLDLMRHFAENRAQVVRTHMNARFFMGGMYNLTVEQPNAAQGFVQVNTIPLTDQTHWVSQQDSVWQGTYFRFQDLTVKAVPAEGYRFVSWSGDLNQTADSLVIRSTKDIRIKAIFAISTSDDEQKVEVPNQLVLLPNYPNPFNPTTTIRWQQDIIGLVELDLYDINGRHVMSISRELFSAGLQQVPFDASRLSSGIYIVSLRNHSRLLSQKIVLLK